MRTFEEIHADVQQAFAARNAEALLGYAGELDLLTLPQAEATASYARGWALQYRDEYLGALAHFRRALPLFEDLGDRSRVARTHRVIGSACVRTSDYASALEHYQQALAIHKELGDLDGVAGDYTGMGNVYREIGDFPLALEHNRKALAQFEKLGDRTGIAGATGNVGIVYRATGDYPMALEYHRRSWAMLEELGDRSGANRVIGNMAIIYSDIGDYPSALEYNRQALAVHEELGERSGVAVVTGNLGAAHFASGDFPAAIECFRRAIPMMEELGNTGGVARLLGNIVAALIHTDQYVEASQLLEQQASMQMDDPEVRAWYASNRSKLAEINGDLDGARDLLLQALEIVTAAGIRLYAAAYHKRLRDLSQLRNDFAGYIEHNNEYNRITEEIRGKEATQKLAMMEAEQKMAKERAEHERHLAVLHSTLPKHIADRVSRGEHVNDHYDNAVVIFLDIVDFTTISEQLTSDQVVQLLDQIFTALDVVCEKHDVVKIKTIGDSYMAVAFPAESSSSEQRAASAALDMLHAVSHIVSPGSSPAGSPEGSLEGAPVRVRIGIHSGTLTAGVIGSTRLQYDVWGDTVNTASRLEATGEPGRIHVSESFAMFLTSGLLSSTSTSPPGPLSSMRGGIDLTPLVIPSVARNERGGAVVAGVRYRGQTELKGKGTMTTYWLEGA